MNQQLFIEKLNSLPPSLQKEVLDFIEFLIQKKADKKTKNVETEKKLSFSWEGGLKELKSHYTSVELQHKANQF